MAKNSLAKKILDYMVKHPDAKPAELATRFSTTAQYIYVLRSQQKKRTTQAAPVVEATPVVEPAPVAEPAPVVEPAAQVDVRVDMVNAPPHYTDGGMEVIDFIESKRLDYHLGNVVKYVSRAGKKGDELEDLSKARWYLTRAIEARMSASK